MRPIVALLICMLACAGSPITWGDISYPARSPNLSAQLTTIMLPPGACPGSLQVSGLGGDVKASGGELGSSQHGLRDPQHSVLYGVWWVVRPDSSATLMAGRSVDGGVTWNPQVPADTLDVSRRGCARPAPSIFADTNGYVHFAYFSEAKEGPGVFFTHTMDGPHIGAGNGIFHSPVAIVYGEKPSMTSITAIGDTVAIAYEDPNSDRPQVDLALSRTSGHIFEVRIPVSSPDLVAADPRVTLSSHGVTVVWHERSGAHTGGARIAARTGHWD